MNYLTNPITIETYRRHFGAGMGDGAKWRTQMVILKWMHTSFLSYSDKINEPGKGFFMYSYSNDYSDIYNYETQINKGKNLYPNIFDYRTHDDIFGQFGQLSSHSWNDNNEFVKLQKRNDSLEITYISDNDHVLSKYVSNMKTIRKILNNIMKPLSGIESLITVTPIDHNSIIEKFNTAVDNNMYRIMADFVENHMYPAVKTDVSNRYINGLIYKHGTKLIKLGDISIGVCRHKSLLYKFLCDELDLRCALIAGIVAP